MLPLLPHLEYITFAEPCAGDGSLIRILQSHGLICTWASDIDPQGENITKMDVLTPTHDLSGHAQIITNPAWDKDLLHPMIDILRVQAPTWLLFYADWIHTRQAVGYRRPTNYLKYCHKIVSIGRVSWEQNGVYGKDNCAWYLFKDTPADTIFYGRK